MVKNGWAKLRENTKPGNADDENDGDSPEQDRRNQLKEAEETAQREGRGVWAEDTPNLKINYSMPKDPAAFLSEYKGKTLDAVIETVSNGTTVRARLLLRPSQHRFVTVTMAGVRSPQSQQYSPQNQANSSTSANEGKPCIKLPTGINVANLLLERGHGTVLRHRQGEDRSQDYEMLMATEMK
ncbi:Tudor domain containing [Puccinia graminis f. sp. tritici]|nr:Tudor domain containing [Puccinia graminis f. sp. tritici]